MPNLRPLAAYQMSSRVPRALTGASQVRELIGQLPLDELVRIDASVDTGRWRRVVRTIWRRDTGVWDIRGIGHGYEVFEWTIELVFEEYWVGVRCSRPSGGQQVLDVDVVRELIDLVEQRQG